MIIGILPQMNETKIKFQQQRIFKDKLSGQLYVK